MPDAEYLRCAGIHQVGVVLVINDKEPLDRCAAECCGRVPQPGSFLLDDTVDEFRVTDHRRANAGLKLAVPVQVHGPDRPTRGGLLPEVDGLHMHLSVIGKDLDVTEMAFPDQPPGVTVNRDRRRSGRRNSAYTGWSGFARIRLTGTGCRTYSAPREGACHGCRRWDMPQAHMPALPSLSMARWCTSSSTNKVGVSSAS